MADQKTIDEALALREKVLAQRDKQQKKWKEYREIAQLVITKATELGKQGAYVDWIKMVLAKQTE